VGDMSKVSKLWVVLSGYVAALAVSLAVYHIYVLLRRATPDSGGMQGFGDLVLFLGVFGFSALIPTVLALYFLRPFPRFWTVFPNASLLVAVLGLVAALMMGKPPQSSWASVFGLLGLLEVMGSPVLALGFGFGAVVAPNRRSRWLLIAAVLTEVAVIGYTAFCIFVVGHWVR